jgi:hypothetical protein
MIANVTRRSTQNSRSPQESQGSRNRTFSLRVLRCLRRTSWLVAALLLCEAPGRAHDFERTQVALTFAHDGSFVLDVTNDAAWFAHRLRPFDGPFADRVVLFVDGREVRPASVEYIAGPPPLATYRLRGRMPLDARTLRWYYGLPADPYPLTIRRADGRIIGEEIAGDAWSRPIDLAGQFHAAPVGPTVAALVVVVLLLVPALIRVARPFTARGMMDTEETIRAS